MKTMDIVAEIVRDSKDQPVAVVVFESERKGVLDEPEIKKAYDSKMQSRVVDLISKLRVQEAPDASATQEEGY